MDLGADFGSMIQQIPPSLQIPTVVAAGFDFFTGCGKGEGNGPAILVISHLMDPGFMVFCTAVKACMINQIELLIL